MTAKGSFEKWPKILLDLTSFLFVMFISSLYTTSDHRGKENVEIHMIKTSIDTKIKMYSMAKRANKDLFCHLTKEIKPIY